MALLGAHSPPKIAAEAAPIGGGLVAGLEMRLAAWMLPLQRRLLPRRRRRVPVRLPDGRTTRFVVAHETDLLVLADVFGDGQYAEPVLRDPKLIIDAGSHIGASVAYFAARYPGCRVVGLEASPSTFARLRANTAVFPNVEVHNVALAPEDGTATFYERAAGWESSLLPRGGGRRVDVPAMSLMSVLAMLGADHVDLLKIDIEGAEYGVLEAFRPAPGVIDVVVGEIHSWMDGTDFTDAEFLALLSDYSVETDESGRDYVFRALSAA